MPPVRTHYELLSIDPSAEPVAIKSAFREQIARYHPDKVAHLGQEFQDLAVRKTAELTAAYKALANPAQRAEYDASLAALHQQVQPDGSREPGVTTPRFAVERAGGDDIVQRALTGRVRAVVVELYGPAQSHRVRGFDLALVPTAAPALMRSPFPRVFVKLRETIDVPQIKEACVDAIRAGLHVAGSPVNILLFGKRLHDEGEILTACEAMRSSANVPAKTYVVVIDAADWRALCCTDPPPALRRFIDRLRA